MVPNVYEDYEFVIADFPNDKNTTTPVMPERE